MASARRGWRARGLPAQPLLDVVDADQPPVPRGADRLGQLDDGLEQILGGAHDAPSARRDEMSRATPDAVAGVAVTGKEAPGSGRGLVTPPRAGPGVALGRRRLSPRSDRGTRRVGEIAVERRTPPTAAVVGQRSGAAVGEVAAGRGGVAQPQLPRVIGAVPVAVVDGAQVSVAEQQRGLLDVVVDAGQGRGGRTGC